MRKHSQHNNYERTHFFRKIYITHFVRNGCKRVTKGLCVRGELETEQTTTYWPPVPLSLAALISRSVGLLNRWSWGPIALCWVLVISTASYLQLWFQFDWLQLAVAPGYVIVWPPPASCGRHICIQFNSSTVKVIPWYLRPNNLFLDWWLGRRSICYMRLSFLFVDIYSVAEPTFSWWMWFFLNKHQCISLCPGILKFCDFLSVALSVSKCMFATELSSSYFKSFFLLSIRLTFPNFLFTISQPKLLLICPCAFSKKSLVEFCFVILEGPVLLVLLDFVLVIFWVLILSLIYFYVLLLILLFLSVVVCFFSLFFIVSLYIFLSLLILLVFTVSLWVIQASFHIQLLHFC